MRHKRRNKTSLLAVLFCVPIVFIAYFAIIYGSQSLALDGITDVKVTLTDGSVRLFDNKSDVDVYCGLLLDSREIKTPVRDVYAETPIEIEYIKDKEKQHYTMYPSLSLTGCMIYSEKGRIYLLSEDSARSFLCRAECLYLYEGVMLPPLLVSSGGAVTEVAPESYTWEYRKIDGSFYGDRSSPTYGGELVHAYDGRKNAFSFAVEPDEISDLTFVTEGGETLAISDIGALSLTEDTVVSVTLRAKWNRISERDYYGEAFYSFKLLYDLPAEITLSRTSVNAGGIAVVAIDHLNADDEINISTELATGSIICYKDSATGRDFALIPVAVTNQSGIYDIDFEVGGSVYALKISVTGHTGLTRPLNETPQEFEAMLSPQMIAAASDSFAELTSGRSAEAYYAFGEKFTPPVQASSLLNYGDEVIILGSGAAIRLPGMVYDVDEGTQVKAAQRGVVVMARATAATGNTVVISHGYGVFSFYFNLSAITCETDDVVTQGQVIGNSGSTGYTWTAGEICQFAVSVGGVFVDPTYFFSGGASFAGLQ